MPPRTGVYRLLLDTSSLVYRAFHSLPHSIVDAKGRPVNAVHGYLDMTARLTREREPDEIVHVYDADWRPADRVREFAGSTAQRPDEPDVTTRQFDELRERLDALGASHRSCGTGARSSRRSGRWACRTPTSPGSSPPTASRSSVPAATTSSSTPAIVR